VEEKALPLLIREKLRNGHLPLGISRFWGGPSDGEQCDACGEPVVDSLVVEGVTSAVGGKKAIQMHVLCFTVWDEERRERRDDVDARERAEAAIARRKDEFTLSHLAWAANGYTVKFRQGIVDIVRTAVDGCMFEDPSRLDGMLDAVRLAFQSLNPARRLEQT
jgi:hypothetical protein